MNNYSNFRDFGEGAVYALPSIQTVVNGTNLDKLFKDDFFGFRTLTVSGRGLLGKEVSLIDVQGMDGALFSRSNYPTREIVVRFRLKAKESEELRRMYEILNTYLSHDNVKIEFTDDVYYFIGSVSSVSNDLEESNSIIGELTFICPDPFKYSSDEIQVSGQGSHVFEDYKGVVNSQSAVIYDLYRPNFFGSSPRFNFSIPQDYSELFIRNLTSGNYLHLRNEDTAFAAGTDFIVDFLEESVTVNGQNGATYIVIDSDFENFVIKGGDEIIVEPTDIQYNMYVRGKSL